MGKRKDPGADRRSRLKEERAEESGPAIELRDVHKSYSGSAVLDGVTCAFPDRSISALVGPSGAGKTTLMRLMLGLTLPDSGEVLFRGRSVNDMNENELLEFRRNFGVLIEGQGSLFGSMSVYDNVAFPLRRQTTLDEDAVREAVYARLHDVGLAQHAQKTPDQLSTGMRVRAAFARAIVTSPDVLIFDSPDTGVDPVRLTLLCDLIEEAHRQEPKTTLVITHDIETVAEIADYLILLHLGRVVQQGSRQDVMDSPDPFTQQFMRGLIAGPLGME